MVHVTITESSNRGRDYYRVKDSQKYEFADEIEGQRFAQSVRELAERHVASGAAKKVD